MTLKESTKASTLMQNNIQNEGTRNWKHKLNPTTKHQENLGGVSVDDDSFACIKIRRRNHSLLYNSQERERDIEGGLTLDGPRLYMKDRKNLPKASTLMQNNIQRRTPNLET
jgi:hypothetical protein